MKTIRALLTLAAIISGLSASVYFSAPQAQTAPGVTPHPQADGVTCYTYLSELECEVVAQAVSTDALPTLTSQPSITATPTTPTPTEPAPTATRTPTQTPIPLTSTPVPAVALFNPSFEQGAAQGWAIYTVNGSPEWNVESLANGADPRAVLDGNKSLRFIVPGNYGVWRAGIFQRVRVGAGRVVTFSASSFFKAGVLPGLEENRIREIASHFDVGIDPAGGQSRDAAGIVWNRAGGDYQWRTLSVSAQATGEYVTVFVECGVGSDWSFPWSLCFADKTSLR